MAMQKTVTLDEEEEIKTTLESLDNDFSDLMVAVRSGLDYKLQNQQLFKDFKRWIEHKLKCVGELTNIDDPDVIFEKLQTHCDFLDCKLIVDMSERFLSDQCFGSGDKSLVDKLKTYLKKAKDLRSSSTVKHLKSQLRSIVQPHLPNLSSMPHIYIKLQNDWFKANIDGLYRLIGQLLPYKSTESILKHIEIGPGSVIITYIVHEAQVNCLIAHAKGKLQFISLVGIFHLVINNVTILKEEENIKFTFNSALFEAVKVGHIEASQFLLELGASIDVVCNKTGKFGHNEATQFLFECRNTTSQTRLGEIFYYEIIYYFLSLKYRYQSIR